MEKVLTMPVKDFKDFIISEVEKSFNATQSVEKGCVMLNDKLQVVAFPLIMRDAVEQQMMEQVLIPDRIKEVNAQTIAVIADSTLQVENKLTNQVETLDAIAALIETKTSAEVAIWEIVKRDDKLVLVFRNDLVDMMKIAGKYLNVSVAGGASVN